MISRPTASSSRLCTGRYEFSALGIGRDGQDAVTLESQPPIRTTVAIRSRQEPDHEHAIGTHGWILEELGPDVWLVELRIPDLTLVGDAWYEVFEMRNSEFERTARLEYDQLQAQRAAGGLTEEEDDEVLDRMDDLWKAMTDDERNYLGHVG